MRVKWWCPTVWLIVWLIGTTPVTAAELSYFDSAGVRIRYIDEGAGEPVVLVHGFTADLSLQWVGPGIVGDLKDDFRVIALDNRGHGRSDKPREPEQYGLEIVVIPGANHMNAFNTAEFKSHLRRFLTDHRLAAGEATATSASGVAP